MERQPSLLQCQCQGGPGQATSRSASHLNLVLKARLQGREPWLPRRTSPGSSPKAPARCDPSSQGRRPARLRSVRVATTNYHVSSLANHFHLLTSARLRSNNLSRRVYVHHPRWPTGSDARQVAKTRTQLNRRLPEGKKLPWPAFGAQWYAGCTTLVVGNSAKAGIRASFVVSPQRDMGYKGETTAEHAQDSSPLTSTSTCSRTPTGSCRVRGRCSRALARA